MTDHPAPNHPPAPEHSPRTCAACRWSNLRPNDRYYLSCTHICRIKAVVMTASTCHLWEARNT